MIMKKHARKWAEPANADYRATCAELGKTPWGNQKGLVHNDGWISDLEGGARGNPTAEPKLEELERQVQGLLALSQEHARQVDEMKEAWRTLQGRYQVATKTAPGPSLKTIET